MATVGRTIFEIGESVFNGNFEVSKFDFFGIVSKLTKNFFLFFFCNTTKVLFTIAEINISAKSDASLSIVSNP